MPFTSSSQALRDEVQKKELLLNCVADDLQNALGNIITSLRLVELEQNPLRMRKLLDLAGQAARQQQNIIHRILNIYAGDLTRLYADLDPACGTHVAVAVRQAGEHAGPIFAEKRVGLDLPFDERGTIPAADGEALAVCIDPARLEHVILSLLENALAVTPAGGRVAVRIEAAADSVSVRVEDGGVPLPEDLREQLFGGGETLPPQSPATELRLQYCRLAVENNDGEIGCDAGGIGGNAFWIRLPRYSSPG